MFRHHQVISSSLFYRNVRAHRSPTTTCATKYEFILIFRRVCLSSSHKIVHVILFAEVMAIVIFKVSAIYRRVSAANKNLHCHRRDGNEHLTSFQHLCTQFWQLRALTNFYVHAAPLKYKSNSHKVQK